MKKSQSSTPPCNRNIYIYISYCNVKNCPHDSKFTEVIRVYDMLYISFLDCILNYLNSP